MVLVRAMWCWETFPLVSTIRFQRRPLCAWLPRPNEVAAEEYAPHCTTNLQLNKACWHCEKASHTNVHQRSSTRRRAFAFMVADDGSLTDHQTQGTDP